ncbi:MAG: anti-sigma factor family protein [Dehalococcoidia bacterium]
MTGHVRYLLSDYLDGELNAEATREVELHLAACADCRDRLRALRRTVRFIKAAGRVDLAPGTLGRSIEDFDRVIMNPASTSEDQRLLMEAVAEHLGLQPDRDSEAKGAGQ